MYIYACVKLDWTRLNFTSLWVLHIKLELKLVKRFELLELKLEFDQYELKLKLWPIKLARYSIKLDLFTSLSMALFLFVILNASQKHYFVVVKPIASSVMKTKPIWPVNHEPVMALVWFISKIIKSIKLVKSGQELVKSVKTKLLNWFILKFPSF